VDSTRKRVERSESSLLSLFELSHELNVGLDPYEIAQLTLFSLMGHFGTSAAALWLNSETDGGGPVLLRCFGLSEGHARRLGPSLAARLIEGRVFEPVAEWARTGAAEAQDALDAGLALAAAVRVHGRSMGVVAIGARLDGDAYGALDLEYLATAAGMVGVAVENARLYQRARESNRQLRESNERLAELDRLKSELLDNVSHELLTPLSVIKGNLDILDVILEEGAAKERIAVSTRQSEKLEGLIKNLLDFSKLEEQGLNLKLEPHDLGDLLRDFADARRPGIAEGLREFSLEVEESLPIVTFDRRRLLQILGELVDNAVKFTDPGSHIRVLAARRGEAIEIEVRDDGAGIPADRLESLFEPFRQGDGSSTREAGGMGLGLALARRLAQAMGGSLEANSEIAVGSRFIVTLRAA
jgi:signal transduction histidine kinase